MRRRDFLIFLAGAMAAWPLAARAQQKAMPVIGVLSTSAPGASAPLMAAFGQGLSEAGRSIGIIARQAMMPLNSAASTPKSPWRICE